MSSSGRWVVINYLGFWNRLWIALTLLMLIHDRHLDVKSSFDSGGAGLTLLDVSKIAKKCWWVGP